MLRNAARELKRRRRVPHQLLLGPLEFNRTLSYGYGRHGATSHAAAATYDGHQAAGFDGRSTDTPLKENRDDSASRLSGRRDLASNWGDSNQRYDRPIARQQRRRVERETDLRKSWKNVSPNSWLADMIDSRGDVDALKQMVAKFRSMRLPVVLMQMLMLQEPPQTPGRANLTPLLPGGDEWARIMGVVYNNGHTADELDHYVYILQGNTDEERCQKFLERNAFHPVFMLTLLLRPSSEITKVSTLNALIDYCRTWYDGRAEWESSRAGRRVSKLPVVPKFNMNPYDFKLIMSGLARHCHRVEPRLLVRLADVTCHYIESLATCPGHGEEIFQKQCDLFNNGLNICRPQPAWRVPQQSMPNAYFWEAQRVLLAMSAGLERPFLVGVDGFRAIREVMAGLPKNQTERHSSTRHTPTWPPYLRPADGMDENMDAEDSWSRSVQAGMLMQEAGFAKTERDDAVDALQGMAVDGVPTIQQRAMLGRNRRVGLWEASIRATRNAQEAWARFQYPPKREWTDRQQIPGKAEYTAMLEKLMLREADPYAMMLPGDKALDFPTDRQGNLTEFETARLRPPSVDEFYRQMRQQGIHPRRRCLCMLVSNAASLQTAHQYLRDSNEKLEVYERLMADDLDSESLKRIDPSVLAAYIQMCSRLVGREGAKQLMRAIRLTGMRIEHMHSHFIPYAWGPILKNLSQHHYGLRMSLASQVSLILQVVEQMGKGSEIPQSTFLQLCKCIRKASGHELDAILSDLAMEESSRRTPLLRLYDGEEARDEMKPDSPLALFSEAASRMKQLFDALCSQEKETQRLLERHQVPALDRMMTRGDPVKSEQAHTYMLTLAYLGEFEEMARVLGWLIEEWGQPEVVRALGELDEPPAFADFCDTLCTFRLLAEPMLDAGVVASLREALLETGLDWQWPDDEVVGDYAETHPDGSMITLRGILEWVRDREIVG